MKMAKMKVNEPKAKWQSITEIVGDIPKTVKRGWNFVVTTCDGEIFPLDNVASIHGFQKALDIQFLYGLVEGLYDAFKIQEREGGGNIIIPAAVINGMVHVGLTRIDRNGNQVLEFPRAFINAGATVLEIAVNEAHSLCEKITCDIRPIAGGRYNPNSTFFVTQTWEQQVWPLEDENVKVVKEDGISYFVLRVDPKNLMRDKDGKYFAFRDEFEATSSTSGTGKKMLACIFFPIGQVTRMVRSGQIHDQFVASGLMIAHNELKLKNLIK
jgi:hypothetical protein